MTPDEIKRWSRERVDQEVRDPKSALRRARLCLREEKFRHGRHADHIDEARQELIAVARIVQAATQED